MTDATSALPDPGLRRSPLHERHAALGAKFAAFGGWEMPLEYAGGGVLREHAAVREAVGVFDVSHLGKARVAGPGAAAFVNSCLTNDLEPRSVPGRRSTRCCCDEATGGVIDDLIAYLRRRRRGLPDPQRGQHRRGGPPAARPPRRTGITVSDQHARTPCWRCRGRARPNC